MARELKQTRCEAMGPPRGISMVTSDEAVKSPAYSPRSSAAKRSARTNFRSVQYIAPNISSREAASFLADILVFDCPPHMSWDRVEQHAGNILGGSSLGHTTLYARMPSLRDPQQIERALKCWTRKEIAGLVVGGFQGGADVQEFEHLLALHERRAALPEGSLKLICVLDTPEAVRQVARIVRSSNRVEALTLSHADVMGRSGGRRPLDGILLSEKQIITAARKAGVAVIGAPVLEVHATEELGRECGQRREQGYSGLFVLSHRQLELVHQTFAAPGSCGAFDSSGAFPIVRGTTAQKISDITVETPVISVPPQPSGLPPDERVRGQLVAGRGHDKPWAKGEICRGPHAVTVDSGMVSLWTAALGTYDPFTLSAELAKSAGFSERLLPDTFLLNLALGLCGSALLETAVAELGIQEVYYERAACVGDTLRGVLMIQDIHENVASARSIIKSRLALFSQSGQRVFSFSLLTAHPGLGANPEVEPVAANELNASGSRELVSQLLASFPSGRAPAPLVAGELFLHAGQGSLSGDTKLSLQSITQQGLPNAGQEVHSEYVMSFSLGMSLAKRDWDGVIHELIEYVAPVHGAKKNSQLSLISYVLEVEALGANFETVKVKTLGLWDIHPASDLRNVDLPKSLFELRPQKPSEYDEICEKYAPMLKGRIAWQSVRRLVRRRS